MVNVNDGIDDKNVNREIILHDDKYDDKIDLDGVDQTR